jgi:hypothetical protein
MNALPAPKASPLTKEAMKIKGRVDALITKMHKEDKFTPSRDQLDEIAETMIDFVSKHHVKITPHDSYMKAAIIDLTEIPLMAPQMQRIAFMTALKDSSHEMDLFLSCF